MLLYNGLLKRDKMGSNQRRYAEICVLNFESCIKWFTQKRQAKNINGKLCIIKNINGKLCIQQIQIQVADSVETCRNYQRI